MRIVPLLVALATLALPLHRAGVAQETGFVTSGGADLDAPAGDVVAEETEYRGRLYTSGVYYTESATGPLGTFELSSPNSLMFGDLRGKLEALHLGGSRWDGTGDFRVRYTPDELSARGYVGGQEFQLRELHVARRSPKNEWVVGRQFVRDVDATKIDGLSYLRHLSPRWDLGMFAGLYPNPFSRSVGTDYRDRRNFDQMPVAGGAWTGYRFARAYGAVGAAAVAPRDERGQDEARAFLTANGYFRVRNGLDVFHYFVGDVVGPAGAQILNAQAGVHWRAKPRLLIEVGASRMSTYAIQIYVRERLEEVQPDAGQPWALNNLEVVRMGSTEGRVGANYSWIESRVDLHGQVRYRTRDAFAAESSQLPMELVNLPPDTQIDVQAGVRKKDLFAKVEGGASAVVIRGDRTSSNFLVLRASRDFWGERLHIDFDASYITYADRCEFAMGMAVDPTCSGTARGRTLRGGVLGVYRHDRNWLFLGDFHYGKNDAKARDATGALVPHPTITTTTFFFRGQYSF